MSWTKENVTPTPTHAILIVQLKSKTGSVDTEVGGGCVEEQKNMVTKWIVLMRLISKCLTEAPAGENSRTFSTKNIQPLWNFRLQ